MIRRVVAGRSSGVFVGRAGELSALLAAVGAGRTHLVLVAGEAGIGKTRLIGEFAGRLGGSAVVLGGRCPEFGNAGVVPFAPFVAVMRALLRRFGIDDVAALLSTAPALAGWLPELAARTGSGTADRLRLFGEILTLLEQFAARGPLVVVLEDLHWADDSSRELLTFLVANLAEHDVLLVGTYRPAGASEFRGLVAELRRHPGVETIALGPLTKHEVGRQLAALLGREPEPGSVGRVFERSAGNPLFVEAIGGAPDEPLAELPELLLAAQHGLPEEVRDLLRLAATAGSPVPHELLQAATDLTPAACRSAIRQLIDHQLLIAVDTGYEFRHILIRQAVSGELLPAERIALHRRLAEVLRGQPDLVAPERFGAELARHAEAAGDLRLALTAAWSAATAAERSAAHPERLEQSARVLALWHKVSGAADLLGVDRLTVLEAAVDAACRGADIRRGIEFADAAVELVSTVDDPLRAARLYRRRAQLRNQTGVGGREDLDRALELVPIDPPNALRGELDAELAGALVFSGRSAEAGAAARAALDIADQLDLLPLAARAHAYLALSQADSPAADEHFTAAHAAAATADPDTLLTVLTWEAAALVAAGNYERSIEVIREALRAAHASFHFAERGPILLVKWAQALEALGRWAEAVELVDDALTDTLPPLSTAALRLCHGRVMLARGAFAEAQSDADSAAAVLGDTAWAGQYRLENAWLRARLAIKYGELERAAEIVAAAFAIDGPTRHPREAWPLLTLAARIPTDTGDLADGLPYASPVDAAYRATFTAVTSGHTDAWRQAVTAWHDLRRPYDAAQAQLSCAVAELASGNRAAAESALRDAATRATELAAAPLLDEIAQVATRARLTIAASDHTDNSTAPRTFGLTTRELDVLRLVARGLSNRQIATELFISGNTAGVHVSRILTKVGAASRTEAAAIASAHGLLEPDRAG
ncbi:helix-turn-helix transcriptional regulator [Nocardia arthritidis]|uniref:AAA family ATPase n=1 Tax=Nocardia arthritidis TaxID=228602 RepID=A0A6G9YF99_9NOCA|nr:helix-turn-helix transcriptional regulator [Nocardia arthritidis]QIS11882.1 AAA family ATPase [Nocardia arthritidis]